MEKEIDRELLLGQYIPMHYHYQMLIDESRMLGFKEAIRLAVPQNGKVLELGGGTGVLSFFASEKASKVWCVEQQPLLADHARKLLELNSADKIVEVVVADAMSYLPPEPVDVVICEMLHSALLREKQIEIISSFKERYTAKFGKRLPRFIPEATILGVDLICQDFNFYGYNAPLPNFQFPGLIDRIEPLSDPYAYSMVQYDINFPKSYKCNQSIPVKKDGNLNALRFITSNSLYLIVKESRSVNWMNQNMIIPLPSSISVHAGDMVQVAFSYEAGAEIDTLRDSLKVQGSSNNPD